MTKPADAERTSRALPEPVSLARHLEPSLALRPKDLATRLVRIVDGLLPVPKDWHVRTGPPDTPSQHMGS